jgi:hypothetical protein
MTKWAHRVQYTEEGIADSKRKRGMRKEAEEMNVSAIGGKDVAPLVVAEGEMVGQVWVTVHAVSPPMGNGNGGQTPYRCISPSVNGGQKIVPPK